MQQAQAQAQSHKPHVDRKLWTRNDQAAYNALRVYQIKNAEPSLLWCEIAERFGLTPTSAKSAYERAAKETKR